MCTKTKADEFLIYIAEHEKELKKALRKNITYDEHLFEDSFQTSILKVYDSLQKNTDIEIKSWKNYAFIALKWNYINMQNMKRKEEERKLDIEEYKESTGEQFLYNSDDDIDEELTVDERMADLRETLKANFGERSTSVFLDYKLGKFSGGVTYETIADEHNVTVDFVKTAVSRIENFIKIFTDKYNKSNPLF